MLDRGVTLAASIAVLAADAQRCRAGRFLFQIANAHDLILNSNRKIL